jgi:hypothetical protein
VGPRLSLDDVERRKVLPLPGLELRPLSCPALCQSLCRLRYPIRVHVCVRRAIAFVNKIVSFRSCLFNDDAVSIDTADYSEGR